ncbi:hypothetical protein AVEN_236881-1 [Araneus ventricosus]|uniref:Uncharacterized protein n=1 Tax=Araneus ventricosus TaxID=182803 RepID=A0A4Y2RBL0_ARAVE|nr:hypothetical protein AVEN_5781-1 [Araneus ventricosus]GBN73193.1 hypothetical protein AVEN_236881-1 [Araneus ventricosus]
MLVSGGNIQSSASSYSLAIFTSRFEATGRIMLAYNFGTDLVILNRGQMTRTTLELAPSTPNSHTTPLGGRQIHDVRFSVQEAHIHGDSSVESNPAASKLKSLPLVHRGPPIIVIP